MVEEEVVEEGVVVESDSIVVVVDVVVLGTQVGRAMLSAPASGKGLHFTRKVTSVKARHAVNFCL